MRFSTFEELTFRITKLPTCSGGNLIIFDRRIVGNIMSSSLVFEVNECLIANTAGRTGVLRGDLLLTLCTNDYLCFVNLRGDVSRMLIVVDGSIFRFWGRCD